MNKCIAQDLNGLGDLLDSIQQQECPQSSFAYWVETIEDTVAMSCNGTQSWPTASAIKFLILPAFYSTFKNNWNATPNELDSILNFSSSYQDVLEMFSSSTRTTIANTIQGYSYKQIASGMMGKAGLPNASYNACANIAIFLLGGPAGTTSSIHALDSNLNTVFIGRYMLKARTTANDNRNALKDFAILIRHIHNKTLSGFVTADYAEMMSSVYSVNYLGYPYYQKSGSLSSYPEVKSRTGYIWNFINNNTLLYSINLVANQGPDSNFSNVLSQMTSLIKARLIANYSDPNTSNIIAIDTCKHYTSPSGNFLWETSGLYHDIISNQNGCDSSVFIDLTIKPDPDTSVQISGNILTATNVNASYQWIDCNSNQAIAGATNQSFIPPQDGSYAVVVTDECTDTSSCYTISNVGINRFKQNEDIKLSHNPGRDQIIFEFEHSESTTISIYTIVGALISEKRYPPAKSIILKEELDAGIYIVQVKRKNQSRSFQIVRK
ncbi:MAG: T9SS type A sorting domain-containing protein [Saprospiraceae bacterium]|nr:T9SS type A sorting domain-containing protein [Saprospiraceae bacterium]